MGRREKVAATRSLRFASLVDILLPFNSNVGVSPGWQLSFWNIRTLRPVPPMPLTVTKVWKRMTLDVGSLAPAYTQVLYRFYGLLSITQMSAGRVRKTSSM